MVPAVTHDDGRHVSLGLDVLRAVAIVWVLLFHARILGLGNTVDVLSSVGWVGVDLFFALSGYLIGVQWLRQRETPGAFRLFYGRRLLRIMPAYLVVVAVYFGWPSLREAKGIMPLWQFITFTENLFITFDQPRAFTHVWSLCVEEHFYLLLPVISVGLARLRWRRAWVAVVIGVVVGGAVLRGWVFAARVAPAAEPDVAYYEQIYYPTWARLDALCGGVLLAVIRVYRPLIFERLARAQAPVLTTAMISLVSGLWLFKDGPTWAAVVCGLPLIAAAMTGLVLAATRWAFRVPGAAMLAAGAYSLYLSHKLAFAWVRDRWPVVLENGWLAALVCTVVAGAVGAVLHWSVERPFLRWRDRVFSFAPHQPQ